MEYYLAIDLGASSGTMQLGSMSGGKMLCEEIHRFPNGMIEKDGRLCWESERLFAEILAGMRKCGEAGKAPASLGIDTWGVDFMLLDADGNALDDAVAYRDHRTDGMDELLSTILGEPALYARTGIQKQMFNTIYQLLAIKETNPGLLERTEHILFTPEYLSYRLSGVTLHEYTIASTTGLLDAKTRDWDWGLIELLGFPKKMFGRIAEPGTKLGGLLPEMKEKVGFDCEVIYPCTHDTGSAVVSAPIDGDTLFLSSGTWSLLGVEQTIPHCDEESRLANFSNEGGYDGTYRFLKNIMGLWIIQSIKKELGRVGAYSYNDLSRMAEESGDFPVRIDVNDQRLMAPESMTEAVKALCKESGQPVPGTVGELMCCVYESLAYSYSEAVQGLERITGKVYDCLAIVGGGSKDRYLNRLTAAACRKKVTAGPGEGTAIGNILVQMISAGVLGDIDEARELVKKSFEVREEN